MSSTLLRNASLHELLAAISHKLGRRECLILADLEDDPSSAKACVGIGDEFHYVPRDKIVAYRK